jgi:hypothetical protein
MIWLIKNPCIVQLDMDFKSFWTNACLMATAEYVKVHAVCTHGNLANYSFVKPIMTNWLCWEKQKNMNL